MRFALNFIVFTGLILFTVQCAKRASPTGGPKDSIPPVLINASPKLNTIFFDKDEFNLTFNEYITLKDINKQLIISPPLNSTQYKVYPVTGASKKVTLKLLDSLFKNTTYTFNFGESIVEYFLNPIEIEAFHIGFRAESNQNLEPIENCIKRYLDNFLKDDRINQQEYEKIIVKWLKPEIKLLKGVKNNES